MSKQIEALEAMRLIAVHCEYCNRIQRAVRAGGRDAGLRRRLDSIHRQMFAAMTGEKPSDQQVKWMRFS